MPQLSPFLFAASRRLRTLHFVPGGSQKFLDKALASRADALILDLEDSVTLPEKAAARTAVGQWLEKQDFGAKTVCVRINALDTDLWQMDLTETLKSGKPDIYMVPKVASKDDLERIDTELSVLEREAGKEPGSTRLLPIVTEVPSAPLRAQEIAASPRVEAITWGAEDLGAELGVKRRRDSQGQYLDVFQLCRSLTLLAAKGSGVQAIDGVYTNLKDIKGCKEEAERAAETGFDGKMTIHPDQIDAVNAAFSPTTEEVMEARELLQAAECQQGAFRHKGRMVDRPHLRYAQGIVDRAVDVPAVPEAAPAKTDEGPIHGKWFEELTEGTVVQHALTRTVTETDNTLFTALSMNPAKLHLDYEAAKKTPFKKPLVNSMFTVALLVGITVLETTHGTTVANLGFDKVVFPKPVFIGDTIRAETEVLSARLSSSDPTRGIVTFEHRAFNQQGDLVCRAQRNALMLRRPQEL